MIPCIESRVEYQAIELGLVTLLSPDADPLSSAVISHRLRM